MTQQLRIGLAARTFCVAAITGLSLVVLEPVALQGTLFLAAVAALALAAQISERMPDGWVLTAEGAIAALLTGIALPEGLVMLPYLVIPALLAGLQVGPVSVVTTVLVEVLALVSVVAASGETGQIEALPEMTGPWLLTTLGIGLAGAWLRAVRFPGSSAQDANYESARRLLSQLRTVARRLSSGLDTLAMSGEVLSTVYQHLGDTNSAVFVKTEGGVLAPLAYRGTNARETLVPEGELVDTCWAEMEPQTAVQATGQSNRRHRTVLPLRVGVRMIGVVLADLPQPPTARALEQLMQALDEHALRLDTALTFDEIRSLATMEERHRLAREIHDGVAQEIASLGYVVDDLAATAATEGQRRKLHGLRSELTRVVSELRLSIFDLRSELSAGLGSTLAEYVREVGARSGMTVHLTLDVAPIRLRSEVEAELLRIAQEAVTNARKHSAAANLWVDCRIHPPFARIVVRDDGQGLGAPREDSFGLKIMRERSARIGANLEISPGNGAEGPRGTTVSITVGVEDPARA